MEWVDVKVEKPEFGKRVLVQLRSSLSDDCESDWIVVGYYCCHDGWKLEMNYAATWPISWSYMPELKDEFKSNKGMMNDTR